MTITLEDEGVIMEKIRAIRQLLILTRKVNLCRSAYGTIKDAYAEDASDQFKNLVACLRELICLATYELFIHTEPFASIDDPISKSILKM